MAYFYMMLVTKAVQIASFLEHNQLKSLDKALIKCDMTLKIRRNAVSLSISTINLFNEMLLSTRWRSPMPLASCSLDSDYSTPVAA